MFYFYVFCLTILIGDISCELNLNSEEIGYISNRLSIEDCRKLVSSLHFEHMPAHLASEERKLPLEASCEDLLTDWLETQDKANATAPQVLIVTRLNELGFTYVADRISAAAFQDMTKKLSEPLDAEDDGSAPGEAEVDKNNGGTTVRSNIVEVITNIPPEKELEEPELALWEILIPSAVIIILIIIGIRSRKNKNFKLSVEDFKKIPFFTRRRPEDAIPLSYSFKK